MWLLLKVCYTLLPCYEDQPDLLWADVTVDGFDWGGVRVEPQEARHRNFRRSLYQLRFGAGRFAQVQRLARDAQAIGE